MSFPAQRPRRRRRTPAMRRLMAETRVGPADLVAPMFVREGIDEAVPVVSMPGVVQHSRDSLRAEVAGLAEVGVGAVLLFGVPAHRDPRGSGAWDPDGIVQLALADVAAEVGDALVVMADVCLDEYTDHGHCGVLDARGEVDNDATLALYGQVAVAQARAGAAVVAPSGMMDGQVGAIRAALDADGHQDVAICAYSAKYASCLYGPFRDAVDVSLHGGDRRGYQQDPANRREAMLEVRADIDQGADMVMVKPATPYLDVVSDVAASVDVAVAAYQVSGEYSMVMAAAERGWLDGDAALGELILSIRRAGADLVVTYAARRMGELWGRDGGGGARR